MINIKVLDCTLRDGGYVNDWNFGRSTLYSIFMRLASAGIELVELGFVDANYTFDMGRSIMPRSKHLPQIYNMHAQNRPMLLVMAMVGNCPPENIDLQEESLVDGIRIVFKKHLINQGLEFAARCKEKGYKIFLQPASVTDYSEDDIRNLAEKANKLDPYAVYIVDTYGLMHKNEVFKYFHLMDKYLLPGVAVGFHSHNNLQMSYSSAIDLLDIETDREVIFDSTLYGIGKDTGNLNTELIVDYLNKYHGKQYDLDQILEAIDQDILKIRQKHEWGYSFTGFLAASNDCDSRYVNYLVSKKTLSVKSINEILSHLGDAKTLFNRKKIEDLYIKFQSNEIDDSAARTCLQDMFTGKMLLILASGSSLNKEAEKIHSFIEKEQPVVIAVNHNPPGYPVDYYFINNAKRYSQMAEFLEQNRDVRIIATSNITPSYMANCHMLNFSRLLVPGDEKIISANATLMLFSLLMQLGIKSACIAGFDGFSSAGDSNYVSSYLSYNNNDDFDRQNTLISNALDEMRKDLDITFITRSNYLDYLE